MAADGRSENGAVLGSGRPKTEPSSAGAAAVLALALLAACSPLDLFQERSATLEVTSTVEGREATVEIAVAQADGRAAPPEEPLTTPYRQRIAVERAAVMVRHLSGPEVRVRLRAGRGADRRHEVETTTRDVALVTGGWRYWPGSWVSAAGF